MSNTLRFDPANFLAQWKAAGDEAKQAEQFFGKAAGQRDRELVARRNKELGTYTLYTRKTGGVLARLESVLCKSRLQERRINALACLSIMFGVDAVDRLLDSSKLGTKAVERAREVSMPSGAIRV